MRRRPEEAHDFVDNAVFSSDAWGNTSSPSYTSSDVIDLSQYAATSIPQGNSHSARSARYSPSAHSSYYEESIHVTNSEHDPFGHSSYEGTSALAPQPQNLHYSEMPSPVRRTRLGAPMPAARPETISHDAPSTPEMVVSSAAPATAPIDTPAPMETPAPPSAHQFVSPSQSFSPATDTEVTIESTLFATPLENVVVQRPPVEVEAPIEPVVQVQQAYEPVAAPISEIGPQSTEEHVLSDFEQEFLEAHSEIVREEEEEKELSSLQSVSLPQTAPSWTPPALFSTGVPGVSYNASNDFFSTPASTESDEDRLYRNERAPRETIQIDMEFIRRHMKNITTNKIAIVLIAVVLAVTAYLIVKPSTDTPTGQQPQPETVIENSPVGKTVVPQQDVANNNPETVNTVPVVNPNASNSQTPPAVQYDSEGNAIYNSNQNFNSE